jgi:hypothetical protein
MQTTVHQQQFFPCLPCLLPLPVQASFAVLSLFCVEPERARALQGEVRSLDAEVQSLEKELAILDSQKRRRLY